MPPFVSREGNVVDGITVIESNIVTANTLALGDRRFARIYEKDPDEEVREMAESPERGFKGSQSKEKGVPRRGHQCTTVQEPPLQAKGGRFSQPVKRIKEGTGKHQGKAGQKGIQGACSQNC